MIRELERIPADAKVACLHLSPNVTLIDHTSSETLLHYLEEHNSLPGSSRRLELNGLEQMRSLSKHHSGMRLNVTLAAGNGNGNDQPLVTVAEPRTELPYPAAHGMRRHGCPWVDRAGRCLSASMAGRS